MANSRSADFCADQIDFITNFTVITNVVMKRVNCIIFLVVTEVFYPSNFMFRISYFV